MHCPDSEALERATLFAVSKNSSIPLYFSHNLSLVRLVGFPPGPATFPSPPYLSPRVTSLLPRRPTSFGASPILAAFPLPQYLRYLLYKLAWIMCVSWAQTSAPCGDGSRPSLPPRPTYHPCFLTHSPPPQTSCSCDALKVGRRQQSYQTSQTSLSQAGVRGSRTPTPLPAHPQATPCTRGVRHERTARASSGRRGSASGSRGGAPLPPVFPPPSDHPPKAPASSAADTARASARSEAKAPPAPGAPTEPT